MPAAHGKSKIHCSVLDGTSDVVHDFLSLIAHCHRHLRWKEIKNPPSAGRSVLDYLQEILKLGVKTMITVSNGLLERIFPD